MNLTDLGWNPTFAERLSQPSCEKINVGRVISVHKGSFLVHTVSGIHTATVSGSFRHEAETAGDFPVVGDWVELKDYGQNEPVLVSALIPRQNCISRQMSGGAKSTGGPMEEQVIAANIDIIFIVSGLDRDFNLRRIERYLSLVYNSGATPVIVLNKADLCDDPLSRLVDIESIAMGVKTHVISAHESSDLYPLRQYLLQGVTIALLGSSGVGKSTIINGLLGSDHLAVRSVSTSVGKGVHTTTHRELIVLPEGGMLIDNPGMRELQLWDDDKGLDTVFADIERLSADCRFIDCAHESEPGCAVWAAIEDGSLEEERLQSFQKLKKELDYLASRKAENARMLERQKGREFARMKKEILRHKKR